MLGLSVCSQVQAGIVSYTDSGWWDSTGYSTDLSFSNYIAGTWACTPTYGCDPTRNVLTRNFFVFDLTELKGDDPVTSATLRINASNVKVGGTYSLWDVDSTMPELRRPLEVDPDTNEFILRQFVYDDLGTGNSYGSTALTTSDSWTIVDIELNVAALASINAKDGCNSQGESVDCLWALGGNLDHDNVDEFAFGLSGGGVRQLIYSTESIPAVPVPAAVWLFGTALIGLIGFGKRRKAA